MTNNHPTLEEAFDEARKLYPGTIAGLEVEYTNFVYRSQHPKAGKPKFSVSKVMPLLVPAIENQIAWRKDTTEFRPPWKNFEVWINNLCWTIEYDIAKVKPQPTCDFCSRPWITMSHGKGKVCGLHSHKLD